ncbi:MAG TPA: 4-(cytidine 5'-diphospho)-2-C-methyl-D-erythritol kinase, partial [Terriglobales bacterium]
LFLLGGAVLGVGRGEEVYPLPDLAPVPCVIATPEIGVSTPQAFADWDEMCRAGVRPSASSGKLTVSNTSDRMVEFGRAVSSWLSGLSHTGGRPSSGVPAGGRGRAETLLLDLVRTGIENDFETVVFPKYPELRKVKSVLLKAGAFYAALSGSGSAVYGLFRTREQAGKAASRLSRSGIPAQATATLTRPQYWKKIFDC